MNKLSPLLIALCVYLAFSCETPNTKTVSHDKLDIKHGPSEEFFLQRMDPNGNFPFKTYTKGLEQAQQDALQINRSIDGFENEWTVQGPGNIGGRVNTISINPDNEAIMYCGFARGGVFKTTDSGDTWNPVFDDQTYNAIGDITLDPQDPNTVYVGTGDPNISGYPFIGGGLYRSEDAGDSWTHLGLMDQRIISKVVIDPTNSDRIFAATMGLPFERNNDRGLYRSEDKGGTWEQVLFLSDSTGIIDLVINPQQPNIMYAAGWDRIRNNTESLVSGQGAKIYKTVDGGDNWSLIEGGLPNQVPNGRIGLAICEGAPNVIYAQYANPQSRFEAIYRSDDDGENWSPIPTDPDNNFIANSPLGGFAWYFGKIRVSPTDPDDLYLLGVDLWRTRDAGQTWTSASPPWWTYEVHADKHELVYLSDESVILGTDGGIYRSDKNNDAWEDIENIPTNQFYRVAYNPHRPDQYYGGAQDNGTTGGNDEDINAWDRIFGGDGFQAAFDPVDDKRFFVETQNGNINVTYDGGNVFDNATEGIEGNDPENWDMPYFISTHDPNKLITGTNKLYLSETFVPLWTPMTADLTDGEAGTTRNGNITEIFESPLLPNLVIAGTGDGNVWIGDVSNTDTFKLVSANLPDQYVTDVVASDTDVNRFFVCHSGYRDNDNAPMIYRTDDSGDTWTHIAANLPTVAINEILIMPSTGDSIMFIGTDAGVYGTIDAATTWERLGSNMTIIPVYDLVHNVATNELVVGTFGRSIQSYDLDPILSPAIDVAVQEPSSLIEKIKVIPTLANDFVQVQYSNIEPNRNSAIAIVSAHGQLIKMVDNISDRNVDQRIDVSALPAGQYFIKVKVRHSVRSVGFVKG